MKKIIIPIIILVALGFGYSCSKSDMAVTTDSKSVTDGKGGSTARITIKGDYLYAVDNSSLKVVDISTPSNPNFVKSIDIGFGIETIYPFKDYLFIGSNIGMYAYSLSDPSNPTQLFQFEHITSCDPVIANDTFAFVTLRNNEICNRWSETRQIDVINIQDMNNPFLQMTYFTQAYPYGLDMEGNHLFVCHGEDGLTVYDINKILMGSGAAEISTISGINAFDAIIWHNTLFVIGESGFYQYDYSDIQNIKIISSILTNS